MTTKPEAQEAREFDVEKCEASASMFDVHDTEVSRLASKLVYDACDEIRRLRAIVARAEPAFVNAMDFRNRCTDELIIAPLKAESAALRERVGKLEQLMRSLLSEDNVRETLSCYVVGIELMDVLDAGADERTKSDKP